MECEVRSAKCEEQCSTVRRKLCSTKYSEILCASFVIQCRAVKCLAQAL